MYTLSSGYVPVDKNAQHLQGYQIWERFILLNWRSTHSARDIGLDFGALKISSDLIHQSNSDTDMVCNKRFLFSTKSVSVEFFLYHLHIGYLKVTIPHTPQTFIYTNLHG